MPYLVVYSISKVNADTTTISRPVFPYDVIAIVLCRSKSIVVLHIFYLSAVCMLRISRKFVAIQMKSIMVIGTSISYTTVCLVILSVHK